MNYEWPLLGTEAEAAAELPLRFYDQVAAIKESDAVEAFARRLAGQMINLGHTAESDRTKPPAYFARQALGSLSALIETIGYQRMNLPPLSRGDCLKRIESAGAMLIALHTRVQQEVPEE